MRLEFTAFTATDKVKLPGLFYQPPQASKKAAVWLHGMGDNGIFYNPTRINALAEQLTNRGVALLAFNNRGAHNRKSLRVEDDLLPEEDRYMLGGTHYERIADAVQDIDGATNFLSEAGYSEMYLIGHSTGANKICVYDKHRPDNPFTKYVLAGPGDDVGLFFTDFGNKRFWNTLSYAAKHLEHEPLRVMPKYTGMHPFSVQAAWDILNPDGDYNAFPYYEATQERLGEKPLFAEYRQIDKPTLVIIGTADEYMHTAGDAEGALKLFMSHSSNAQLKCNDFVSITGADHGFHGCETDFAIQVSDWLTHD